MELLCFAAGIGLGYLFLKKKNEEKPPFETENQNEPEEEKIYPMALRNGYGVTRDKNPTFAEQWVNIMNYSGESQREKDYEGTEENYTAENLE